VTMTWGVEDLPQRSDHYRFYRGPIHLAGQLWLDAEGARLYDWSGAMSAPLCDPEACAAMRAVLPSPGEYLGDALLQVFVRETASGPELYDAYWVTFFDHGREWERIRWGATVQVRPVPPEHDSLRRRAGA
jgi:hypothetical protein